MKQWKRLSFYLILNILVSGCTTFSVLFLWEKSHDALPSRISSQLSGNVSETASPIGNGTPTVTPVLKSTETQTFIAYQVQSGDTFESIAEQYNISVDELVSINGFSKSQPLGDGEVLQIPLHPRLSVMIDSVIGAGDLDQEGVVLKLRGEGELSLAGWQLRSDNGDIYTFPQITLYRNSELYIYTKKGTNTVHSLYWGLDRPVWSPGSRVTLYNDSGNQQTSYLIP